MTYPTQGFNPTVPIAIDGGLNGLVGDVVGRKDDTAVAVADNVSSAMRYLKGIIAPVGGAFIAAYNGIVSFDDTAGVAGTVFPIGTPNHPCSVEADVKTICIATHIYKISVVGTFHVPSAMEGYEFIGLGRYSATNDIDFNGQDVDASVFRYLNIVGAQGGTSHIVAEDCHLFNATNIMGTFFRCLFQTATLRGGGGSIIDMLECTGWQGTATITVTTPTSFNLFGWSGALTLTGLAVGGTVNIYGNGAVITLAAACVGGTVNLYGDARVINNSLIACVVNDYTIQKVYGAYTVPAGLTHTLDKSVEIVGDLTIGAGATLNINGNCKVSGNIDNGALSTLTIKGNCEVVGSVTNTTGAINIYGNFTVDTGITNTTGAINVAGDCIINGNDLTNTTGAITINGNLVCRSISNTGLLGTITIRGNCTVLLNLSNDSTGTITIGGNCQVTGYLHNHAAAGTILVAGDLTVAGAVTNDNAGAVITVTGIGRIYGIITNTGTLTYRSVPSGPLAYEGIVSGIAGAPNFQCSGLIGFGNDYFEGYWAYVVYDAAALGGAPQGQQLVCTGYVSATGDFTVAAFTPVLTVGDKVLLIHPSVASMLGLTPARAGYLDELNAPNIPADVDTLKTEILRGLYTKDQWCATPIASLAFSNGAGDKNFSDVVFPANFLPAGAVIDSVFLVLHWRKQVDTSAGANAVNGAGKTIRVKKAAGGWLADSLVGITMADNELATAASATEGGTIIIGSANIASEVDDTNGITYNIQTNETNFAATSIVVDGASLTLYDIYTGLRVIFKVG